MKRRRAERAAQYESAAYSTIQARLAGNVEHLRGTMGWTQEEAAHRCEMATRQYQHVEHGTANVTLTTLARLTDGFGVDVEALFVRRRPAKRRSVV
jgi:transcriptional regulator with XRE-family HTH domain